MLEELPYDILHKLWTEHDLGLRDQLNLSCIRGIEERLRSKGPVWAVTYDSSWADDRKHGFLRWVRKNAGWIQTLRIRSAHISDAKYLLSLMSLSYPAGAVLDLTILNDALLQRFCDLSSVHTFHRLQSLTVMPSSSDFIARCLQLARRFPGLTTLRIECDEDADDDSEGDGIEFPLGMKDLYFTSNERLSEAVAKAVHRCVGLESLSLCLSKNVVDALPDMQGLRTLVARGTVDDGIVNALFSKCPYLHTLDGYEDHCLHVPNIDELVFPQTLRNLSLSVTDTPGGDSPLWTSSVEHVSLSIESDPQQFVVLPSEIASSAIRFLSIRSCCEVHLPDLRSSMIRDLYIQAPCSHVGGLSGSMAFDAFPTPFVLTDDDLTETED